MRQLFLLPGAIKRDRAIDQWMREQPEQLAGIASAWFEVMRSCGDDVRELIHDDQPTACVGDAAFAYVDTFTAHVNVGFFHGAVRFPFIGAPVIPSEFGVRFAADHIVEGGRHLYVATGIGTSIIPVRFRVPPAIAILTLQ